MNKIEPNTDCHDFHVNIPLGEEALKLWKEEMNSAHNFLEETELIVSVNCYPKTVENDASRWWIRNC